MIKFFFSCDDLLGYSTPGTPTSNRFVGLSPRDPTFLHQQQVRSFFLLHNLNCSSYSYYFIHHF